MAVRGGVAVFGGANWERKAECDSDAGGERSCDGGKRWSAGGKWRLRCCGVSKGEIREEEVKATGCSGD